MKRPSHDPGPSSGMGHIEGDGKPSFARKEPRRSRGDAPPPPDAPSSDDIIILSRTARERKRRTGTRRGRDAGSAPASWRALGWIKAGAPGFPFEGSDERISRIEDLVPGIREGDFFLQVDGDSMIDAGLQPGQYVVVRPEMPVRNGEICAVWVEGSGATLKRVYFDHALVRLVPANPSYAVQIYPADEVHIQGVLVAALSVRSFKQ